MDAQEVQSEVILNKVQKQVKKGEECRYFLFVLGKNRSGGIRRLGASFLLVVDSINSGGDKMRYEIYLYYLKKDTPLIYRLLLIITFHLILQAIRELTSQ